MKYNWYTSSRNYVAYLQGIGWNRSIHRSGIFWFVMGIAITTLRSEEIVVMSELQVTETVDPPSWRYGEIGPFRIWSLLDDDYTRNLVEGELRSWDLFPSQLLELDGKRICLIYTNRELVKPAIPPLEMKPKKELKGGVNWLQNIFIHQNADAFVQVMNMELLNRPYGLGDDIVRAVLRFNKDRMPMWLGESLVGRYGLFERGIEGQLRPDRLRLANLAGWQNEITAKKNQEMYTGQLVPMEELLSDEWPNARDDPDSFDRWSAQSALFLQWLVAGRGVREKHWENFRRIAAYSLYYPLLGPAFAEETGYSFAEVEAELRRYLPRAVRINQIVRVPPFYRLGSLKMRTAETLDAHLVDEVDERLAEFGDFGKDP